MKTDEWLKTVLSFLPFAEDRRAAAQELSDHIEDRSEALRLAFPELDDEALEERVVAALGDPAETGRALREVHRPWVSAVLMGLRIVAVILLLISFLPLYDFVRNTCFSALPPTEAEIEVKYFPPAIAPDVDCELICQEEIKAGPYTITVPWARMVRGENTDGVEIFRAGVLVKVEGSIWNTANSFRYMRFKLPDGRRIYARGESLGRKGGIQYFFFQTLNWFRLPEEGHFDLIYEGSETPIVLTFRY